jgi:hypothetical protein
MARSGLELSFDFESSGGLGGLANVDRISIGGQVSRGDGERSVESNQCIVLVACSRLDAVSMALKYPLEPVDCEFVTGEL